MRTSCKIAALHGTPLAMTVCQYWLRGNCRYGARCRYEHPARPEEPANLTDSPALIDVLRSDLQLRLPEYHFSAYSNSFFPNQNLISDDLSPEELRLKAYAEGRETGQLTNYILLADQLERHYREKREHVLKTHNTNAPKLDGQVRKPTVQQSWNYQRVFPLPTLQDSEAFMLDKFSFQKIPELPPTLEMCFVSLK